MKVSRIIFVVLAWLFVLGVVAQVFFAGMTVVAQEWPWTNHIMLGHTLLLPLIGMLITMYTGKLPRQTKVATWLLVLTYIVAADFVIFLRGSVPVVSALHPVLALVLFALGVWVAWQATGLMRQPAAADTATVAPSA